MTIPGEGLVSIRLPNSQQYSFALDILIREKRQESDDLARSEKRVLIQRKIAQLVLIAILFASETRAQEPSAPKKESPVAADYSIASKQSAALPRPEHRFWDKKNDWLFAGVGAARTFDYFSTLNLRRRGGQEILVTNVLLDNHAAFAVVEAAGTGVSIGASYLFHRYGHHKLD